MIMGFWVFFPLTVLPDLGGSLLAGSSPLYCPHCIFVQGIEGFSRAARRPLQSISVGFRLCLSVPQFLPLFVWSRALGASQLVLHLYCKKIRSSACNTFNSFAGCFRPGQFLPSFPCCATLVTKEKQFCYVLLFVCSLLLFPWTIPTSLGGNTKIKVKYIRWPFRKSSDVSVNNQITKCTDKSGLNLVLVPLEQYVPYVPCLLLFFLLIAVF